MKGDCIVRVSGGLGNQMFQYVFYIWLKNNGINAKLDNSHYVYYKPNKRNRSDSIHNGYELERIFNINANYATYDESCAIGDIKVDTFSKIRRKIFGVKATHIRENYFIDLQELKCKLEKLDGVYLDGTWGTFNYAKDIEDVIRSKFIFPKFSNYLNEEMASLISNSNSVCVHIRRGDYLKLQDIYDLPTEKYYLNAINKIKTFIDDPLFFVFSDDIKWCKDNILLNNCYYIDWNVKEESYRDMQLMSLCKAFVIPCSTFSMWAAWLCNYPDKKVVRPRFCFKDHNINQNWPWPKDWEIEGE